MDGTVSESTSCVVRLHGGSQAAELRWSPATQWQGIRIDRLTGNRSDRAHPTPPGKHGHCSGTVRPEINGTTDRGFGDNTPGRAAVWEGTSEPLVTMGNVTLAVI